MSGKVAVAVGAGSLRQAFAQTALALEGMGGQRHAPHGLAGVEPLPVSGTPPAPSRARAASGVARSVQGARRGRTSEGRQVASLTLSQAAARHAAEGRRRANLHQEGVAALQEGGDPLSEADRLAEVAEPVFGGDPPPRGGTGRSGC